MEVCQILQGFASRTDLSFQGRPDVPCMKVKLNDMAGHVAAADALPVTAVFPSPRREEALRVRCDAGFDGQKGLPLPCDASSSMRLSLIRFGASCCGLCEQEQEECKCKHGGLISRKDPAHVLLR